MITDVDEGAYVSENVFHNGDVAKNMPTSDNAEAKISIIHNNSLGNRVFMIRNM